MGMVSALTPALRKEATLLAEKLGISVEEAVAKYFSKSTPTIEKEFAKEIPGALTDRIRNAQQGFKVREPDISAEKSLDAIRPDRPTYQERGLVPVGKPGELAPIEPIKTGTGFTFKDSPTYQERGLVPVGKPGELAPIEPIKTGTGFTFKDSPNMDAETVPTQLLLGPGKKSMSLSDKLAIGAAAGVGATAVGATSYLTPQRSNEVRDVPLSGKEKGLRAFQSSFNQYTPPVSDPTSPSKSQFSDHFNQPEQAPEPTKPDSSNPLFNTDNFAKPEEATQPATTTSKTTEIVNSIVPPASKTEIVSSSQAEKSLRAATQAYNSIQYKAPESTTKELRSKLEEAYNNKISRNDWAEIATTLANAIAQYGSAQQAGDKYNGGIKFAPGVDYGARSDRAFREYSHATDAADKTDSAKERGSLQEHQSKMDVLRGKTDLAKLDVDMERERARAAAAAQDKLPAPGSMTDRDKEASRREDAATERSTAETKVDRETISKMDQVLYLSKAIAAATEKKDKARLIAQRAKLSSGLSAEQEAVAIAGAEKSRGLFNPFTPESSPESEQAALDAALAKEKAVVAARIASRESGAAQSSAPSTGKTDQKPVSVRHKPSGETRQFPAGSVELQNALQNPEFEIVR